MDTLVETSSIRRIGRDEAFDLAATEYRRYVDVLEGLAPDEWRARTDCPDWHVLDMARHVLGACHGCASIRQSLHQVRAGRRWAAAHGRPEIDGINAVQVAERQHLGPAEVVTRLRHTAPAAVRGRRRVPAPLRRIDVGDGAGGPLRLGFLMEVIYTRDVWMHRVDTLRAVGRLDRAVLTPEHDGRLVADVVAQWAEEHGQPFDLTLDGPAGGRFRQGTGGPALHLDAVAFMRTLSGREPGQGLLGHPVLF
ncbi:MAG: maleylpyruvate isomerase family mycothiol-dependent enzyme [Actinomycetes bacterium]